MPGVLHFCVYQFLSGCCFRTPVADGRMLEMNNMWRKDANRGRAGTLLIG